MLNDSILSPVAISITARVLNISNVRCVLPTQTSPVHLIILFKILAVILWVDLTVADHEYIYKFIDSIKLISSCCSRVIDATTYHLRSGLWEHLFK